MRFLNDRQPVHDLTYSDVFLVPGFTDVNSRMDVSLATPDEIGTTIPVVVSNMTAVTGRRMAETVSRRGGLAVFPQDIALNVIEKMTAAVKTAHTTLDTPITLGPSDTVGNALDLINKRAHGAVIVTDGAGRPVGVFVETDATRVDRFTALEDVMSREPVVISEGLDARQMFESLAEHRIHLAPVVDASARVVGIVTEKGALRSTVYKPAVDTSSELLIAAAVGVNEDAPRRARGLVDAGVNVIVIDTAHGHQQKTLETLRAVRSVTSNHAVVAGNVVTGKGVDALIDAGADIVKVGVGPGAMCTTRMMTAVGRPQFSAVVECAAAARARGRHIWADGGIRHPRDVALALAAGAANVMIGSWMAGTLESAADTKRDTDGRLYKENFGMASRRAVVDRYQGESAFARSRKELFEEGISESRMYIDPAAPSAEDIIDKIVSGVRSAFAYGGALTVNEFHDRAVVGIQSYSGYIEGQPLFQSW